MQPNASAISLQMPMLIGCGLTRRPLTTIASSGEHLMMMLAAKLLRLLQPLLQSAGHVGLCCLARTFRNECS
jgi:hypothetical protein